MAGKHHQKMLREKIRSSLTRDQYSTVEISTFSTAPICHGDTGKGLDSRSTGLTQHTPNLPERLENHSEGDFHWKIKTGRREMPSFDGDLSDTDVWNIINWIKSQSE